MIATTTYATTAPTSRAVMSYALPARIASFETVATTSPVESCRADRRPGARDVVCDDLRHPERRLEPVEDREPVSQHAAHGLRQTEAEQDQRPERELPLSMSSDPVLDRAADRERHQGLGQHPERRRRARPKPSVAQLLPSDPDEQADRRARVGDARVRDAADRFSSKNSPCRGAGRPPAFRS